MEDVNNNQTTKTQPEGNGIQNGKLFTQEEVNRIVSERLARERTKTESSPTPEEQREVELNARENKVTCKEYLQEKDYPSKLIEVFPTNNAEEFKSSVEKLIELFPEVKPVRTERLEGPGYTKGLGNQYCESSFAEVFKQH